MRERCQACRFATSSLINSCFRLFFRRNSPITARAASQFYNSGCVAVYIGRASGCAGWYSMAGRTCGRETLVAMIPIVAPQMGQTIDGRGFLSRISKRHGFTRSTTCSRRISFLLQAWRNPYDLARRNPRGSTWSMSR